MALVLGTLPAPSHPLMVAGEAHLSTERVQKFPEDKEIRGCQERPCHYQGKEHPIL